MREQKANDNGFPVVGEQAKEQQIFPFEQLVEYDGAANKITINANVTINGDTNIGELDIDSGDAPKGQVLTADGESGASWENRVEYLNLESESGNLTNAQIEVAEQDNVIITLDGQFYYKNSQSDEAIVFKAPAKVVDDDTIAEKVVIDLSDNTYSYSYEVVSAGSSFEPVYDDELNDSSTNAVQNKVIYEELEQYAKKDGYYENFGYARRSGIADNLFNEEGKLLDPNVSESAGTVYADQPFVQRATAMTMNAYLNDELISVASGVEEWKKDEAFSIVRNQQVQNGNFATTTNWGTYHATLSVLNNEATITPSGNNGQISQRGNYIPNHKYLLFALVKSDDGCNLRFALQGSSAITSGNFEATSSYKLFATILQFNTTVSDYANIVLYNSTNENVFNVKNIGAIDLTQWFASRPAIATALTGDNGVKWFLQQYPQALSLDYDDGTIIDTETYEYQTTGINLWNEEVELGKYIISDGSTMTHTGALMSKNFTEVFPGSTYYFKCPVSGNIVLYDQNKDIISIVQYRANNTFTVPNNCKYIKVSCYEYGNTYNNDIQICNHFTETHIEQTYHKFEIHKDTVDWSWTSTGKGKSAGSAADTKDYVLGKNIEKVGQVNLGTLTWTYVTSGTYPRFVALLSQAKHPDNVNSLPNITCSKYARATHNDLSNIGVDKAITLQVGGDYLWVADSSYTDATTFKAAMSDVILNFELTTPIESDMVGDEIITTVEENDYGNETKVPASGNMFSGSATTIFYQDNVLRQVYNNKSNIDSLQEDVNTLEAKIPDAPTTDGTYVLKATVSGGVATYSWVLEE